MLTRKLRNFRITSVPCLSNCIRWMQFIWHKVLLRHFIRNLQGLLTLHNRRSNYFAENKLYEASTFTIRNSFAVSKRVLEYNSCRYKPLANHGFDSSRERVLQESAHEQKHHLARCWGCCVDSREMPRRRHPDAGHTTYIASSTWTPESIIIITRCYQTDKRKKNCSNKVTRVKNTAY